MMLDERTERLVTASVLASRPELRDELSAYLQSMNTLGDIFRNELYEAFLQLYLFAGFPAALEAMKALTKAWPQTDHSDPDLAEVTARVALSSHGEVLERGEDLYQRVYSENADTVKKEMLRLSPELAAWAVFEGYGKTLSRIGLDMRTRELCIVGVLAQLGWQRQLFSHSLGALNIGASHDEVAGALSIGSKGDSEQGSIYLRLLHKATLA